MLARTDPATKAKTGEIVQVRILCQGFFEGGRECGVQPTVGAEAVRVGIQVWIAVNSPIRYRSELDEHRRRCGSPLIGMEYGAFLEEVSIVLVIFGQLVRKPTSCNRAPSQYLFDNGADGR